MALSEIIKTALEIPWFYVWKKKIFHRSVICSFKTSCELQRSCESNLYTLIKIKALNIILIL